jgi:DNA-binding beta-propeller fold protein YncE
LAFSAAKLVSDPKNATLATVKVGTAPVGVAVFDHGDRVFVCDSDRFDARGANSGLTIVNATAALAHYPSVIASLSAGLFPRDVAVEPNERVVLVSDFASDQLQAVNVSGLR